MLQRTLPSGANYQRTTNKRDMANNRVGVVEAVASVSVFVRGLHPNLPLMPHACLSRSSLLCAHLQCLIFSCTSVVYYIDQHLSIFWIPDYLRLTTWLTSFGPGTARPLARGRFDESQRPSQTLPSQSTPNVASPVRRAVGQSLAALVGISWPPIAALSHARRRRSRREIAN